MQSELPTALNVFDNNYQLEYTESYSGTVHQETAIEGYQYCTSLKEPLSRSCLRTSFGSYFLFPFGENKNKQLVFLRGSSAITLALRAVYN